MMNQAVPRSSLDDFLKSEYEHVANAHFRAIQTITSFFRHYLLIMSLPASVFIFVLKEPGSQSTIQTMKYFRIPIATGLSLVSAVGLFVFLYIMNLRMDAVLYARVINSIRKHHFDRSEIDIWTQLRMRILPQSSRFPRYFEGSYFIWVVFVFGIVNAIYALAAAFVAKSFQPNIIMWLCFGIMLMVHLGLYVIYARHRELSYLRSNIIGVDIDGVLNNHRQTFCQVLSRLKGIEIDPELITHIPVHDHPKLSVSYEEERAVFNEPDYWTSQVIVDDAKESLERARNILKMKVYIFTCRPWPDVKGNRDQRRAQTKFLRACKHPTIFDRISVITSSRRERPIDRITREWLIRNDIPFDKLVVERGNDYSSDPAGQKHNRFYHAQKNKIRYFIEDDIEKAAKLAYICDVVFLITQPYNIPNSDMPEAIREFAIRLPHNVFRVGGWKEIWHQLKRLS